MGREKNSRGRRKKRKKPRAGRVGAGLKHHHGAIDLGAKIGANDLGANNIDAMLGAKNYGAMVVAMSTSRLRQRLRQLRTLAS